MKNKSCLPWNPWPVSIIAFFTVAILGCGTFIAFCSRHPADLISANYYEEEVKYQGQINRVQQTQEHAPLASVGYDAMAHRIILSVPPARPGIVPTGQIELYRPSDANLDRKMKLDLDPRGFQSLDAAQLLPGLWKVRLNWSMDNHEFSLDQKIIIPERAR
jgi:nitrogen fixation protein FixH